MKLIRFFIAIAAIGGAISWTLASAITLWMALLTLTKAQEQVERIRAESA